MGAVQRSMGNVTASIRLFAIYLFLLGASLVAIPNVMLQLFGFPVTQEVWVRVVGALVVIIGSLYLVAARAELHTVFRWSVPARFAVFGFFTAFVLLGFAPPMLILFGGVDVAGALWTAAALRKSARD